MRTLKQCKLRKVKGGVMDIQKQIAFEKFHAKECNCDYNELKRRLDHQEKVMGHRYLPTSPRHEAWLVWDAAWQAKAQAVPECINDIQAWIAKYSFSALDASIVDFPVVDANELAEFIDSLNIDVAVPEGFVLVPQDSLKVALSWMNEDIDPWQMGGDSFAELYEHKPILEAVIEAREQKG